MLWNKIISITVFAFLILVSACNLPAGPAVVNNKNQDPSDAIETRAAVIVASTAAAQTVVANAVASTLAAMATNTDEPPFASSSTPTPSFTSAPTFTLTPDVPTVSVSAQTNCRSGPGKVYDILGIMDVGQTAQVVGRSAYNDNWIIKLPSNPSITCWLWGQYASVTGDTAGLPVVTPPPSPTPAASFDVVYESTGACNFGTYALKFKITNPGNVTWESNRVIVTDLATGETKDYSWDNFPNFNDVGCGPVSTDLNLVPGSASYTSSLALSTNPSGDWIMATIRVCSLDGMTGICLEKKLTFTP